MNKKMKYYFLSCKYGGKRENRNVNGWYATTIECDFFNFPAIIKVLGQKLKEESNIDADSICIVCITPISEEEFNDNKIENNID